MRLELILVSSILIFSGCIQQEKTMEQLCVAECKSALARGEDLSNGPCLGEIATDWVCDVAHWPRQDIDNNPANQCSAFREGRASHFVEVDPACKFIRQL